MSILCKQELPNKLPLSTVTSVIKVAHEISVIGLEQASTDNFNSAWKSWINEPSNISRAHALFTNALEPIDISEIPYTALSDRVHSLLQAAWPVLTEFQKTEFPEETRDIEFGQSQESEALYHKVANIWNEDSEMVKLREQPTSTASASSTNF